MEPLRERDVRLLLDVVSESHAHRSLAAFRTGILPSLRRLVPADVATYNEVEPGVRALSIADPEDALGVLPDPGEVLARLGDQHPLIRHHVETRDGRAYKLSDFVSRDELHALELYTEAFGPLHVEFQIAITLPSQPSVVIGVALSRERRDFSERDRTLLNYARPHLLQAYRAVAAFARLHATLRAVEHGLGARGQGIVTLGRDGALEYVSPVARTLLETAFPGWRGSRLPAPLREPVAVPVVIGNTLVARFVPARGSGEPDALLLEARTEALPVAAVEALGLTRRQAEIVRLVALGRPTAEIAGQLGITVATTRKHLERAFTRLGVTSRTEAAATAWAGVETVSSA